MGKTLKRLSVGALFLVLGGCTIPYENEDALAEMYSTLTPEEQLHFRGGIQYEREQRVNELMAEVWDD